MSKVARFAVLVAALASLFVVLTSSAGAVTWHNSGGTAFTAGGGASTLDFTHADGTDAPLPCFGGTATGDAPVGTFGSAYSIAGTLTYAPCYNFGAGVHFFTHCAFRLTAQAWTAGSPAVTSGVADLTCVLAADQPPYPPFCHIHGTSQADYVNPVGATPGRLTFTRSITLTATHASGGSSCPWIGATGPGSVAAVDWLEHTMTLGAGGPVLTRTP
jgi:hypothetical protein